MLAMIVTMTMMIAIKVAMTLMIAIKVDFDDSGVDKKTIMLIGIKVYHPRIITWRKQAFYILRLRPPMGST